MTKEQVSTIAIGTLEDPPAGLKTARFAPQENYNKPILAVPREYLPEFKSSKYGQKDETREMAVYDVVDLTTGEIHIGVMTGSGAIKDRLKQYVPGGSKNKTDEPVMFAVKIVKVPQERGEPYYTLQNLEGNELKYAQAWDKKYGIAKVNEARRAKMAAAEEAGTVAPPWADDSDDLAPLNSGSSNGAGESAPAADNGSAGQFSDDALAKAIADL